MEPLNNTFTSKAAKSGPVVTQLMKFFSDDKKKDLAHVSKLWMDSALVAKKEEPLSRLQVHQVLFRDFNKRAAEIKPEQVGSELLETWK